jgi:drug/metabolite transporter (DMT)-like permease
MSARLPRPDTTVPKMPLPIVGCLAATWLIWGSTYLAIKWALVSLPPLFQMGSRFVAASLLLGAWGRWRGLPWPTRREWQNAVILGALMLAGGYGATAVAEATVSSGLVVAFIAVVPALVALAQWPYGLRPTRSEALGIALGLGGVWLLTQGQGFSGSWEGLAAIGIACGTWSLGSVWALHGLPGGRPLNLAPGAAGYASQMLAGGALLLAGAWWVGERPAWPPDPRAVACWGYLVLAGSVVGFSAYMVLLQRTTAALASSYTFVNPVIAMVLGVAIGGETVTPLEWGAAAVISAGVLLLALRR